MVAESTSPVGRGTAGLLLINGMPSSPLLSGPIEGLIAGRILPTGAGVGVLGSWGRNGQGYAGEEDTAPPELSGGAAVGGCGGEVCASEKDTLMASFCPS